MFVLNDTRLFEVSVPPDPKAVSIGGKDRPVVVVEFGVETLVYQRVGGAGYNASQGDRLTAIGYPSAHGLTLWQGHTPSLQRD